MKTDSKWVISHIFNQNNKYIVPEFQRDYSWKKVQCQQLIKDITQNKEKHFIGNIIIQKINGTSFFNNKWKLIDGQQRLTSLCLILLAIKKISSNENIINKIDKYLFLKDQNDYLTTESKLNLNPIDQEIYDLLLKDIDLKPFQKQSELFKNYKHIFETLKKQINKKQIIIDRFLSSIETLYFIEIILDDSEDAQIIFERINGTGLDLTSIDLVKNYLLMGDSDISRLYKQYWLVMKNILSKKFNQFIWHYLIYKLNDWIIEKDVYTKFKTYVIDNRIEKEDILKELLELSKIYSNLIKSSFQDLEINYYLKQFNLINVNTIWPFMLHLFVDYQNQKIELDTLKKCIILMRNHLVRAIIVSPKGIKEWNKFYPILYNRTISNIQNNDNYFDSIASYLIYEKANTNRRFANDYEFEKALLEDKIINTNKVIANLILFEIEKTVNSNNYLLEEYTNYKLEHILPLKRQKQWEEEIGINSYSQTIEKYGSTLGNLTLVPKNYNLENLSFYRKRSYLQDWSQKLFINESITTPNRWNENSINARATSLVKIAIKAFSVIEPTTKIQFSKKDYDVSIKLSQYKLIDDFSKIYKINYKLFDNNKQENKTITNFFDDAINYMYSYDPETMHNLAISNFFLLQTLTLVIYHMIRL